MSTPSPRPAPRTRSLALLKHSRTLLLLWALAAPLTGCLMHALPPGPAVSEVPPDAAHRPIFDYERAEVPFHNAVLHEMETDRYLVRHVRFPSVSENGQPDNLVRGYYWESKRPGRQPLIIVLPIWGGHNYPSKKIAKRIRRASDGGAHVFVVRGEQHLFDWPGLGKAEDEETFLRLWREGAQRELATLVDVRRIIDWAEVRDDVDTERVGLVGFSHSAVLAATIAAAEPRIDATVSVMGGGFAHEMLARCPLLRSDAMRETATETLGWTLEELAARIEPITRPLDPVTYPGRVDPSSVLLIEASKDTCMPAEGRKALYEALGHPQRIVIEAGHQKAFLAMTPMTANRLRGRIYSFLEDRLALKAPAPPTG